jgi:hypothetical protein
LQSTTARELIQDDAQSWMVHEYDAAKKKKRKDKGSLFVGNGMICYGSETDKSLPVQQYPILDVTKYLLDSKNLHIEIQGAKSAVLDLQASSKSEAKAILAKITDSTKAAQSASTHINNSAPASPPVQTQVGSQPPVLPPIQNREIAPSQPQRPVQPPVVEQHVEEEEEDEEGANCIPKWGICVYDFQAEGGDELSVEENEQLYVLNYERTDGWWRVQKVDGDVGLVPSAYVQFDDEEEEYHPTVAAPIHQAHADVDEIRRKREQEERELQQRRIAEDEAREQQREQREREVQSIREQEGIERQKIRDKEDGERTRKEQEENDRLIAEEIDRREREEVHRKHEEEERRKQVQEAAKRAEVARQKQVEEDYKRKEMERKASLSRQRSQKNHQDLPKPDASMVRTWTDRSGTFRVEAQYIDFHNGKLRLHKLNGVKIDVPVEKMCDEDVQWVENYQRNANRPPPPPQVQEEPEEPTPVMPPRSKTEPQAPPQKKLNTNWDWFDWFMVIGIPMQASLQYSSAFKADKLDDSDIGKLTHKQMKTLGLKEEHVRRVERYVESGVPEDADDDEEKSKIKQAQIEKDEELARKLQSDWESEQSKTNSRSVPAGRPRPNVSAPKDVHPDLLDFLGSSSDNTKESEKPKGDLIGFQDDAWAPRSDSSPAIGASSGSSSMQSMMPMQTGPSSEELAAAQKASEAERLRLNEEEQIQKIQIMSLKRQAQEQQQQLEQLQQLTNQQLEVQKQLAMQTGNQQNHQQQMQRMQQMQYEQQQIQQHLEPTLPQNSQLQQQILQQQQQLHQQLQQLPNNNQQQQLLQQQQQLQQQFQNPAGRPRPTANHNVAIDPSLGQWQPQQQVQATGFQPGAMVLSGQQPTGYQATGMNPQWQQLQSQMTGITPGYNGQPNYQQPMATSNVPLSSVLPQPLAPTAAGQLHAQPTGRHWNTATPDNPFGSPAMSSVQFSTPSPQSFNPSVLQAQMTGQPSHNLFTPQGSMQCKSGYIHHLITYTKSLI